MPKATLSFNLPEESVEFQNAVNSGRLAAIIYDMDDWLRDKIKYRNKEDSDDMIKAYQLCRDALTEMRNEINETL